MDTLSEVIKDTTKNILKTIMLGKNKTKAINKLLKIIQ